MSEHGWTPPPGIELGIEEPLPDFLPPMLASPGAEPFSNPAWIFEPKFDGYRCLAFVEHGEVRLRSRNNKPFDDQFRSLARSLATWDGPDVVLDGEVVAFEDGRPSFGALQQATDAGRVRRGGVTIPVQLFVFDVLHLDGRSTRALPLAARRILLNSLPELPVDVPIGPMVIGQGESLFEELAERGWEGVIAKRADSVYHDRRTRDWLKVKHVLGQELVVCGFTDPKSGGRTGFGALLLAYYDGDDLVYAGKVGTGFTQAFLESFGARLETLRIEDRPIQRGNLDERHPRWVRPELVVQVGFAEWTSDGRLRHPRFLGLRADKDPRDVRREKVAGDVSVGGRPPRTSSASRRI